MRTNEERIRAIRKRTAEIRTDQRRKKQRMIEAVSIAACMIVICGMGIWMPDLSGRHIGGIVSANGTASLIASHEQLGYILMGILSFFLGVCVTVLFYRLHRRNSEKHMEDEEDEL